VKESRKILFKEIVCEIARSKIRIKLAKLKKRNNIKRFEGIKKNFKSTLFNRLTEVVFHPGRMCKWSEDPLIPDPEDQMDYTRFNLTFRQIIRNIKCILIEQNNSYWDIRMSFNYELLFNSKLSLKIPILTKHYYDTMKKSRQILFKEILKKIAMRKLIRENNFLGDIRLGLINFPFHDKSMNVFYREISEEIAQIVWHPSRKYVWPEDYLIYDSDEDDSMDYALTNCTIRYIKMSMKLRSRNINFYQCIKSIYQRVMLQLKLRVLFLQTQN
jgi:hypothetical protein